MRKSEATKRAALLVAALALLGAAAAEDIQVTPLARDGHVLVSFTLADGLTAEVHDAIRSGLPITFTYDIELRRAIGYWFDRTIGSATVTATVQYDNLTRRNQLARAVDGRMEDSKISEDEQVVRRWLTAFERLPLFSTRELETNGEYYVRVRSRTQPRVAWSFWPWDRGSSSGHATFTFIP